MTTELVELADRLEALLSDAYQWPPSNRDAFIEACEADLPKLLEAIRALASRAGGWRTIESAPEDGTPIFIAAIDDGQVFDIIHGHFEVLDEDEDDGPWDIRGGEPWCSYEGRSAGIYFNHWLPGKEWETRWKFGPGSGYTHWTPAIAAIAALDSEESK